MLGLPDLSPLAVRANFAWIRTIILRQTEKKRVGLNEAPSQTQTGACLGYSVLPLLVPEKNPF